MYDPDIIIQAYKAMCLQNFIFQHKHGAVSKRFLFNAIQCLGYPETIMASITYVGMLQLILATNFNFPQNNEESAVLDDITEGRYMVKFGCGRRVSKGKRSIMRETCLMGDGRDPAADVNPIISDCMAWTLNAHRNKH